MKIGILSDIHAEPQALRRVLADMPSVDRVLCAGDAVSEYQFCAETVQLLQQVNAQCIQGNHEMVLFSGGNAAYLKNVRPSLRRHCSMSLPQRPSRLSSKSQEYAS